MMSSSCEPARGLLERQIASFEYPFPNGRREFRLEDKRREQDGSPEQLALRARQEGEREGAAQAKKAFDESLRSTRVQIEAALATFAEEKKKYFRQVEEEVVQLALAIAHKVIHREAQVDRF